MSSSKVRIGIEATLNYFDKIGVSTGIVAAGLSILMMLLITYSVFARYVLNRPHFWVEEITAYIFVGSFFLSLGYSTLKEAHVASDIVISHAPMKVQYVVSMVGYVFVLIVCFAIVYSGSCMTITYFKFGWKSSTQLMVPLWPAIAMVPVGFIVFALTVLSRIYNITKRFRTTGSIASQHNGG
jgi:TRAP-type mannitol/chloroaromatic compound transport system permease small subunit